LSHKTFLILGNGVAGTTAAETIRNEDPNSRVLIVTDEAHPLYNRVMLPHCLKLMVPESRLFMRSAESHSRNGIEFLPRTRITRLSLSEKVALTENGDEIHYEKLLIASGGQPNRLEVPGAEGGGVYNLQYLDDVLKIKDAVNHARSAVVVGGSFIGYEFANGFASRNLQTTWLIRGPRFMHRVLDEEAGELIDFMAREAGIHPVYGDEIVAVARRNGMPSGISTRGGLNIEADIIGCGIGLSRNLEFLRGTGVPTRQGVITDKYLKTEIPDLFAAGDVAEFEDVTIGRQHAMGAWTSAAPQGRVAGLNMVGRKEVFRTIPFCVNPLFYTHIRFFGLTHNLPSGVDSVWGSEMKSRKYRRLFFKDKRLVGAIAIGPLMGESRLRWLDLMRSHEQVSAREELLDI